MSYLPKKVIDDIHKYLDGPTTTFVFENDLDYYYSSAYLNDGGNPNYLNPATTSTDLGYCERYAGKSLIKNFFNIPQIWYFNHIVFEELAATDNAEFYFAAGDVVYGNSPQYNAANKTGFGFKIKRESGVYNVYGFSHDGSGTASYTAVLTTVVEGDMLNLRALLNPGASVDFSFSKNGAAFSTPVLLSSHLPSSSVGANILSLGFGNNSTTMSKSAVVAFGDVQRKLLL